MMKQIGIVVHGGAGTDSEHIKKNIKEYEDGLREAIEEGYKILERGGKAVDAVEAAVRKLEDNPLFNSGRGSAVNNKGEVEMDASIMDGKTLKAGAVCMVKNVKNPVTLARYIMDHTSHVLLSDHGALEFAKDQDLELEPDSYFVTEHQYDLFLEERDKDDVEELMKKRVHGTVGAVAADKDGNVAAATSSGGTTNALAGRIGDSCIIGAGTFANNNTCAISSTGDGEFIINGVIAHSIADVMEYKGYDIQRACDYVIHEKNKNTEGDIGVIGICPSGKIGISFNSERMHRAWKSTDLPLQVKIYK